MEVSFGESADWGAFVRDVKRADNEIAKHLRRNLSRIAKPIALEVKVAALGLPSSGGQADKWRKKKGVIAGASLRQGIAAAVETKIQPTRPGRFSIRIRVSGTKFRAATGKTVTLPRYMEDMHSKGRWRHPVYGNYENWVAQDSHPYLLPTVIPHKPEVVFAVRVALMEAAKAVGFH